MTLWPVWTPARAVVGSLQRVNEHNFIVYFSEIWQLMIVLTVRHVLFWSHGRRLSSFQACLKTRQRARARLIRSQDLEDGCPAEGSCYLECRLCFPAVLIWSFWSPWPFQLQYSHWRNEILIPLMDPNLIAEYGTALGGVPWVLCAFETVLCPGLLRHISSE